MQDVHANFDNSVVVCKELVYIGAPEIEDGTEKERRSHGHRSTDSDAFTYTVIF